MKLYLLSQDVNEGYDTYDACVVAAENAAQARRIHPCSVTGWEKSVRPFDDWAGCCNQVKVIYIGEAKPGTEVGVVLASYNAG